MQNCIRETDGKRLLGGGGPKRRWKNDYINLFLGADSLRS
jgi:hypothetical protein